MPALNDQSPMPFGAHQGVPMEKVPAKYFHLLWHTGLKDDLRSDVADYIHRNISALEKESPDLEWERREHPHKEEREKKDGLYQVTTSSFVAGFVIRGGKVKSHECAPILQKRLAYWFTQARRIADIPVAVELADLYTKL